MSYKRQAHSGTCLGDLSYKSRDSNSSPGVRATNCSLAIERTDEVARRIWARLSVAVVFVIVLALGIGITPVQAGKDRTPPTTPTDLRVTGMTAYSVALAWGPSTDNSGSVTYKICCANTSSETFPGPASSHVYKAGLEPGRTFTLFIIARDAAGNYSKQSNSVTFTLPLDTTPPSKPAVSVTDVGPTYVTLAWSSVEDGPNVWFNVYLNGSIVRQGTKDPADLLVHSRPRRPTPSPFKHTTLAETYRP